MKKYYLFIALAMVATMTVSCKNSNKKAEKDAEATAEVVEAAKTILADDVLAAIDEYAQIFADEAGNFKFPEILSSGLTDEEKLVKPDYLLDPNTVNDMVTKSQKVAALAIIWTEKYVREVYDMPVEESDAAIIRLVAELNHPIDIDDAKDMQPSERAKATYERCKENGELAYFWQFSFAVQTELKYLIANNPEPIFRNVTDEQINAMRNRFKACREALAILAEYDEEIAGINTIFLNNRGVNNAEEAEIIWATVESIKQHTIEARNIYATRRANLLK